MRSPLLTIMTNAALKAGKALLRDFGEVDQLHVSRKGASNFVTKTDLRVEKMLYTELKKNRPDYGFLLEEGGEIPAPDGIHRWIIDPLDGTSNFIHAVPYFCIAVALEKTVRPGVAEIIAGLIYDPIHNDLFTAEKGRGALLNDRRITVSAREGLDEAMLVTGSLRYDADRDASLSALRRIASQTVVRHTGASALDLAYVAAGRYDACWFSALQPWDMAAGMLLVQEAGGLVTQAGGEAATPFSPTLLAGNRPIHGKVMKLLAGSGTGN